MNFVIMIIHDESIRVTCAEFLSWQLFVITVSVFFADQSVLSEDSGLTF